MRRIDYTAATARERSHRHRQCLQGAAFTKLAGLMCAPQRPSTAALVVPSVLLGILVLPAVVPLALAGVLLVATAQSFGAIGVTHSKKSLKAGFEYIPATVYRCERRH